MHTMIRSGQPRELLALIPYQLGFVPQDSAVVVSVRADATAGLVARVDTDDLASSTHGPHVARTLAGHLGADGATHVVLVLYGRHDVRSAPGREVDRAAAARRHLEAALAAARGGLTVWAVTGTG
ncbi:DUF4192 family protein, partial [Cellulomonas bogoriensis]|uniref:DUF4192 family protein n=1 Tax=Cellulomonas bogoriensis TaxID=301388 RepID=UPI0005518DE7